jgi:hypothetical protein
MSLGRRSVGSIGPGSFEGHPLLAPITEDYRRQSVVATRGPDEFCGEGAMTGKPLRLATVTTLSTCEIVRLTKEILSRIVPEDSDFADYFLNHLLTRTARVEADSVDQFNSSEMRLARALLLLAHYGDDLGVEPIPLTVNQNTLAELRLLATPPYVRDGSHSRHWTALEANCGENLLGTLSRPQASAPLPSRTR